MGRGLSYITLPSQLTFNSLSQILSPEDQAHEDLHRRNRRAAVRDRSRLWPDNTIPYLIDPEFSGKREMERERERAAGKLEGEGR